MKLFTVGPVAMFPRTLKIASEQLPYFRTSEFSDLMLENASLFRKSVRASEEAKVVFLTASGTGGMEASVINCFDKRDKLLVINGGEFGKRFSQICDIHGIAYDEVKMDFGDGLTSEALVPYEDVTYSGMLVNLHETSTGQLYNMKLLSSFCKRKHMYLVADAIGAYGADAIDFEQDGIDVLITSSQKALALAPGISVVVISERMFRERVSSISSGSMYLDFMLHIKNMERGQTPFTPAVDVLIQMQDRLKDIDRIGIETLNRRTHNLALRFRTNAVKDGWEIPQYPLSDALTPLLMKPYAEKMYLRLKDEYGLVVTPSGGKLKDTMLRIGHLGNVEWKDYEQLLEAMRRIRESI